MIGIGGSKTNAFACSTANNPRMKISSIILQSPRKVLRWKSFKLREGKHLILTHEIHALARYPESAWRLIKIGRLGAVCAWTP